MRQRITLFHQNDDAIDPSSIKLDSRSFKGPDINAVREDRLTFTLGELPAELRSLLVQTNELHIRWSNSNSHNNLGIWPSRLPPGLHIFYKPLLAAEESATDTQLCELLRKTQAGDCVTPKKSFTSLPTSSSAQPSPLQYYHPLEYLRPVIEYAAQHLCSGDEPDCGYRVRRLESASSLDISYDAASHAVKISALWDQSVQPLDFQARANERVEVGLLTPDQPKHLQRHELGVTGLLTVLGENDEPKPTLFAFPSRHRTAGVGFKMELVAPTGLHPNLRLIVNSNVPPMEDMACAIYAYFTLPSIVFPDKYQLDDRLFLASKNLTALRYVSQPIDLEAPDYVMHLWGSSLLLEIKPTPLKDKTITAEIPLHLRYGAPDKGGEQPFEMPYPALFWACEMDEDMQLPNNPFDRVNLGYDGLFDDHTLFWHLDPTPHDGNSLYVGGFVPVLDLDKSRSVGTGTMIVVLIGFAWVVWKLFAVYQRAGYGAETLVVEKEKKTK